MSVLGNGTKFNSDNFIFALANTMSVTTSIPGYGTLTGIANGASDVVYQIPVDGSSPNTPNLTPGYYLYTLRITLSGITWSASCAGNLQFVLEYTENSVLAARRVWRVFVNDADRVDPEVCFTIGIPMVNPSNTGNIAIRVFNFTGADITGSYTVTVNQYNFTRLADEVSVVSL